MPATSTARSPAPAATQPPSQDDLAKVRALFRTGLLSESVFHAVATAAKRGAAPVEEQLITIRAGCALLGVSTPTFRKLLRDPSAGIVWRKIGTKSVRISKLSILRYIDAKGGDAND